jgi:hypothetical protein
VNSHGKKNINAIERNVGVGKDDFREDAVHDNIGFGF